MILNEKQRYAIDLLATGNYTTVDIAKMVGVSRTALWEWRKNPDFTVELDKRLTAITTEANERLKAMYMPVVDEIVRLALSDKTETRTKGDLLKYLANRVAGTPAAAVNIDFEDKTVSEQTNALEEFKQFIAAQVAAKE